MNTRFQFQDSATDYLPRAFIPNRHIWDLVEYLSMHRVHVRYSYHPEHFVVTFLNLDKAAARQLLEEWADAHTRPRTCEPV